MYFKPLNFSVVIMKRISQQRFEKLIERKSKQIPIFIVFLMIIFIITKLLYDLTL